MRLRSGKVIYPYEKKKKEITLRADQSPNFTWDRISAGIFSEVMSKYYPFNKYLEIHNVASSFPDLRLMNCSYDCDYREVKDEVLNSISNIIFALKKQLTIIDLVFCIKAHLKVISSFLKKIHSDYYDDMVDYVDLEECDKCYFSKKDMIHMGPCKIKKVMRRMEKYDQLIGEQNYSAGVFIDTVILMKSYSRICQDLIKKLDELTGLLNLQIALQSCRNLQ